jgi:hypothetical protein
MNHHYEHLKSCTELRATELWMEMSQWENGIKGDLSVYRGAVSFLKTQDLILYTFSTNCVNSISYFASQTLRT